MGTGVQVDSARVVGDRAGMSVHVGDGFVAPGDSVLGTAVIVCVIVGVNVLVGEGTLAPVEVGRCVSAMVG